MNSIDRGCRAPRWRGYAAVAGAMTFAACASSPPLLPSHPADPRAPETPVTASTTLSADAAEGAPAEPPSDRGMDHGGGMEGMHGPGEDRGDAATARAPDDGGTFADAASADVSPEPRRPRGAPQRSTGADAGHGMGAMPGMKRTAAGACDGETR